MKIHIRTSPHSRLSPVLRQNFSLTASKILGRLTASSRYNTTAKFSLSSENFSSQSGHFGLCGQALISIMFAIAIFANITVTAFADCGPKASVTVNVKGFESAKAYYGESDIYYATLLSREITTGPSFAYIEDKRSAEEVSEKHEDKIWSAFQCYRDEDGYYYLQNHWELSGDDTFCWGYCPPDEFKILLYFPETDRYQVSEPLERYAFTSYFTIDIAESTPKVSAGKDAEDFFAELIAFMIRVVITIGLELLVALWFGYRSKKAVKIILITNTVTQIALNIVLNIANFKGGLITAAIFYVLAELAVFTAEAIVYAIKLPKATEKRTGKVRAGLYALAANACSFIVGGVLTVFLFNISDWFRYI